MPGKLDLHVHPMADFRASLSWYVMEDDTKVVFDLDGAQAWMQINPWPSAPIQLSIEDDAIVIHLSAIETNNIVTPSDYAINVEFPSGERRTVLVGKILGGKVRWSQ